MFDENEELKIIREQAARLLDEYSTATHLKELLEIPGSFDKRAWTKAIELGWPSLSAPEALDGLGFGLSGLALLAQELGRKTTSLPLIPAYVCANAIATTNQPAAELVAVARSVVSGDAIACLAFGEAGESGLSLQPSTRFNGAQLTGQKAITPFAAVAEYALVVADEGGEPVLVLVKLNQKGVVRKVSSSFDQARASAELFFNGADAIRIGTAPAQKLIEQSQGLAALITAFEQIGGAEAAMYMARDYACERKVFAQPIGRFQAIKHKIADMYWRIEVAKGCAIDALEAFENQSSDWLGLAAAARVSATQAYDFAATENMQTHAGIGTTWEAMPHHYYRRARSLALELGSTGFWRNKVVEDLGLSAEGDERKQSVSEELYQYRLEARRWLAKHAPAFSGEVRKGLSFEADLELGRRWQALKAQAGYAAINLPSEYGGGGKSELHKIVFGEEELRYQLPTEYFVISTAQVMAIFLRHGSDQDKQKLAPLAIRGEHIWCQMFSEPGAGSDLAAVRFKAVRETRDGIDGWRLDGQKLWTSWAHVAQWGFLVARTDSTQAKHAGITTFFVDMTLPGITIRPIRRMAGHDDVNEVFFENVFIPDSQRLGPVGKGFNVAMEMLMVERIAGVYDESIGGVSLDKLISLAKDARLSGRAAILDGQIRAELAQGLIERQALRSIYRRAMATIEQGGEPGPEGSIRKLILGRARQRQGALALDLMGPSGAYMDPQGDFRTDFAWSWIDPAGRVAGGTDEVLLSTIGERVLGLPQDHRPDKSVPFNQIDTL